MCHIPIVAGFFPARGRPRIAYNRRILSVCLRCHEPPDCCPFSLSAMQHNLQVVRRLAPSSPGGGLSGKCLRPRHPRVAHALQQADAFALLNIEAAAQLRHHGLAHPIIMLEGMFGSDELPDYCAHHLIPVVHQPQQLEMVAAGRLARPLDVWIKLNTGMNRLRFYCRSTCLKP